MVNSVTLNTAANEPSTAAAAAFPVVGLGASAGGLAALQRFFENVPARTGMAFVVVVHLSPKHESTLHKILQNVTRMPVQQVVDTLPIRPDHVYVIPPSHGLSMVDGSLCLTDPPRSDGRNIAIDLFFRTMAQAHRERAVCVVLSGTGSDGTVGLGRVKELGGVSIVQSPGDAEFDDMPRNAIASGQVDLVLPAADIPQKLIELWHNAQRIELPEPPPDLAASPTVDGATTRAIDALQGVMDWLRERTGHDFAHYKRATVLRRIERRMQVNTTPTIPAYLELLHLDAEETPALLQDMLISVTNFFRDREAFEALERQLEVLHAERPPHRPVRAWVAGCATGEEGYSVAMLLCDEFAREPAAPDIQVFASDIDQRAIDFARHGKYGEAVVTDVPPSLLRRHFIKEADGLRITRNIRDRITFSTHNLLRDPPFTRLDLVCCRNVLIYLDRAAQAQVLKTFHYALQPGGLLMLGSAETVDTTEGLFEVIDKKQRLYRALPGAGSRRIDALQVAVPVPFAPTSFPVSARIDTTPVEELHHRLRDKLAAPSMLVDAAYNLLHVDHRAAMFLRHIGGVPTAQLLTLIHPDLRPALRATLQHASKARAAVESPLVRIERRMGERFVRMTARPVLSGESGGSVAHLVVTFDEIEATLSTGDGANAPARDAVVQSLEAELEAVRSELTKGSAQSATASEDLRASNEELQAVNEELRSTTEELETSTEELQSTNEELLTVNQELRSGVDETAKLNDDLRNLIASTDIAIVFLDREFLLKRFTPKATTLFNLIGTDIGRPLRDITHRLEYDALWDDIEHVLATLQQVEREVRTDDGRWFLTRLLPYRAGEDRIDGVVMSFVDITAHHEVQARLNESERYVRLVGRSTQDYAMLATDPQGLVTWWAQGAQRLFGYEADEILGKSIELLFTPEDRSAGIPRLEMQTALAAGRAEDDRWMMRKDGSIFFCGGVMTRLEDEELVGFAKIARDLTQVRQSDSERRARLEAEREARLRLEESSGMKDEFLAVMSHELKNPLHLMRLHTDLLLQLPETRPIAAVQRSVGSIHRAIQAQVKIIDDLLDWSRLRTGKLQLKLEAVDLRAIVERIASAARMDAQAKGVEFELDAPNELMVSADAVRIEQVAWNLFNNAVKFTPPGGWVKVIGEAQDGQAVLSVEDCGDGIDPAFLPDVFDMFRQASGEARGKGGLGIGLALVKRLVDMHGGEVSVQSPGVGQGCRFTVRLPLLDAPPVVEAPRLAAGRLDGVRVLLADDDHDARNALEHLLVLGGATVVGVHCALAALELVATSRFDALVIDVANPALDALQLLGRIRERVQPVRIRAIAMSGRPSATEQAAAMAAGFDDFIAKPVDVGRLMDMLSAGRDAQA